MGFFFSPLQNYSLQTRLFCASHAQICTLRGTSLLEFVLQAGVVKTCCSSIGLKCASQHPCQAALQLLYIQGLQHTLLAHVGIWKQHTPRSTPTPPTQQQQQTNTQNNNQNQRIERLLTFCFCVQVHGRTCLHFTFYNLASEHLLPPKNPFVDMIPF